MKREGYLIERIADPDNLRLAFWKARKGKNHRDEVERFRRRLDANLASLRLEILAGRACVGDYSYFRIYDPKERLICAAPFRERVLHHALMNVCHPIFERFQTYDSFATRIGKGQYAALDRARAYTRRYRWFCKMDVRKFFDSIHHETLQCKLLHLFKDPALLDIFNSIIGSYETERGCGLPIGNLTSQYFANFYLGYADHYGRERLGAQAYVRYMDDMVIWSESKEYLPVMARKFEKYISEELKLSLKPLCINSVDKGVPFLGYTLFPGNVRLNKHSKNRFRQKMALYESFLESGEWSQDDYARHVSPLVAFTRYADSAGYRHYLLKGAD